MTNGNESRNRRIRVSALRIKWRGLLQVSMLEIAAQMIEFVAELNRDLVDDMREEMKKMKKRNRRDKE